MGTSRAGSDNGAGMTENETKGRSKVNEAYENIMTRRSIRKYKPDMVEKELIDKVVAAGLCAPSGKNAQSSSVIVVTDKEMRDKIMDENRRIGGWPEDFDPFYGAPVILIVIADATNKNGIYDGSCTLENMMLAAHALGLGSCWINRARQEFDTAFGKNILKQLGIEGEWIGVGHLSLGYPDEEAKTPRVKDGRVYYIDQTKGE